MKTYSEDEIEQYIKKTLSAMPWKNGRPPMTPANSARFIVAHMLKKQGMLLRDDNTIIGPNGQRVGRFSQAVWKDKEVEWSWMPTGGSSYVVSRIKIEDRQ